VGFVEHRLSLTGHRKQEELQEQDPKDLNDTKSGRKHFSSGLLFHREKVVTHGLVHALPPERLLVRHLLNQHLFAVDDVNTLIELVATNLSAAQVKDITMYHVLRTMY
jgi:hypothetical protein